MRHGRRILATAVLWLTAVGGQQAAAQPASTPPQMLEDAALHDVFFLDRNRGWAVGDRGVIWMTEDGGRRWALADSPVNCSLQSIHFTDDQNGWIVGGWTQPYSHRTSGVVLRTENGGRRWKQVPSETLPKLSKVVFFDRRRGWAVGMPSAMYPAGVFRSEDGGRSWSSFGVNQSNDWLVGDFCDPDHGLVAGRNGAASAVSTGALQPIGKPNIGLRHLRAAQATDPLSLKLAGDGGVLLVTEDATRSWLSPELPLSPDVIDKLDFRAIASAGEYCWLAGNPGSCLLRSSDRGRTWRLLHTDQSLPIHALQFVDKDRGWAVGAFGTILATVDGGETWTPQHSGGTRASLLGLFAEPSDVPLEVLARYCGDEGYLGVVESLTRRDVETTSAMGVDEEQRLAAGVVAASGSYANTSWRFPLRQSGTSMSADAIALGWSLTNGADGSQLLEEYLVLRIRQWRPEVVITRSSDPRRNDVLATMVSQAVLTATQKAADPAAYTNQLQVLGLKTWEVKKVCAVTDGPSSGGMGIDTSQLATRLGRSIHEHASQSYALMHKEWTPVPRKRGIELLSSTLPPAIASRDLFSGVAIANGSEARRVEGHPQATSLAELRIVTQKQRAIELLLTRASADAESLASWSAQIDELVRDLSPIAGGEILFQLSQRYREIRRYELACATLQHLIRMYPTHPLSDAAIVWCIEYLASEEVSLAFGSPPPLGSHQVQQASATDAFNAALPPGVDRELEVTHYDSRAERAGFDAPVDVTDPLQRLILQAENAQHRRPALFSEPRLRFAVAAAYRTQGNLNAASRIYQQVAGSQPLDAWRQSAHGELWLASRKGHPPKPLLSCPGTLDKPLLDGKLDEQFWATATPAQLSSQLGDDAEWPATVQFAHDDEFLYVGVQCRKINGLIYALSEGVRGRDPDLSSQDRVELLLDTNRDYSSYFKFIVDNRGWTGESVSGDVGWNPEWFVAAESTEESWTIEAAIPLQELGHEQLPFGEVWACGVQRVVPGVGFQSWSQPASISGCAEGFGFLSFD